jgi:hypothetical protein
LTNIEIFLPGAENITCTPTQSTSGKASPSPKSPPAIPKPFKKPKGTSSNEK